MNWHGWLAALSVAMSLTACVPGVARQAGAPDATYLPKNNRNIPEHGDGKGGGVGGDM